MFWILTNESAIRSLMVVEQGSQHFESASKFSHLLIRGLIKGLKENLWFFYIILIELLYIIVVDCKIYSGKFLEVVFTPLN